MHWETVIGLEVHAQLKTHSKLFSGASTQYGAEPNTQTSYIDAGLPGVLPVLNRKAVEMAIQFGLAINATINNNSYFERKNYIYPDLPKGYQISQFQCPIVSDGYLPIELSNGQQKNIQIVRAHLEEDAGKSIHDFYSHYTGIDLNRAGIPLLEIVTAPCLYSIEETINYLKNLHQLLVFMEICDGNMQEGSFRCDVNLSIRPQGSQQLGVRTELKNLNSFRYIEKAIQYEVIRHQTLLESGLKVEQETRLFNPETNTTHAMRSKEQEQDYRYFPEPDLLPIEISAQWIASIQQHLPPNPLILKNRLHAEYGLDVNDTEFLFSSPELFQFFEYLQKHSNASPKLILNWLQIHILPAMKALNKKNFTEVISTPQFIDLLNHLAEEHISNQQAKTIFNLMQNSNDLVQVILENHGLKNTMDEKKLEAMIQEILNKNPEQVQAYRAGKTKLLAFFVGQIMKATKGKADAQLINQILKNLLTI